MLITAAATLAVGLTGTSALAAPDADTEVTFDVEAGTLDITAPATADLGTGAPGDVITGQIGPVTVDDTRAGADASWDATVLAEDFTTGTATATETISVSLVDYWSGAATATTGDGTFTPGQANAGAAVPLDDVTPVAAFTHDGGSGNNSAAWNPTLDVNVPLANQAGEYTGTVTHSVA
jgi:hypothetical protein